MIRILQVLLDTILIVLSTWNVAIAPYTKVEESFNVQAVHDLITLGLDQIDQFDHIHFPGAVKRTCVSALILALPTILLKSSAKRWALGIAGVCVTINTIFPTPLSKFSTSTIQLILTETKLYHLLLCRVILALLSCGSIIYLRRSVERSCSKRTKTIGIWLSLFLYPMPHYLFYSSRFLPNFLCLPLVNIAIAHFISGDVTRSIALFTLIGVIFRFEILVFTAILCFLSTTGILGRQKLLSLKSAVVAIAISGIFSLFLTGRLDSYFWDTLSFPEIESFFFNVVDGNSSQWGVEPLHSYFMKYIPRLFASGLETVPILALGFLTVSLKQRFKKDSVSVDYTNYGVGTITTLMWTSLLYVFAVSLNGHKEWRFISYTIPVICIGASCSTQFIIHSSKRYMRTLIYLILVLTFVSSVASSIVFSLISSWNYAGGNAAQKLNLRIIEKYQNDLSMLKPVTVHWDVGTCMNGASRFTQIGDNKFLRDVFKDEITIPRYWVIYDKTETLYELTQAVNYFDYWIQYEDEPLLPLDNGYEWLLIDVEEGYSGLNWKTLKSLIESPKHVLYQATNAIKTSDTKWFRNLFDSLVMKEIKARIYERSVIE
ncbi:hypothetical protein CANINC_003285 [Pichia inconspicua]|uniref:Mannosyltransferase n=1 Tax=Pichia inconspicua TaxID=52247 RepID=A0A4T0X039_9ASCO|nr:hypothetical protein CANINC_003285 [[Candida] inconspicua]